MRVGYIRVMKVCGAALFAFGLVGGVLGGDDAGITQVVKKGNEVWGAANDLYRRFSQVPRTEELALVLAEGGTNVPVGVSAVGQGRFAGVCRIAVDVHVAADEVRKSVVFRFMVDGLGLCQCVYDETGAVVWALEFGKRTEGRKGRLERAFEFSRRGDVIRTWCRDGKDEILAAERSGGRLVREGRWEQVHRFFTNLRDVLSGRSLGEECIESRIDEVLSSCLQEISLTNGNALVVKTRTWGEREWIRIGDVGRYRQVPNGSVFLVGRGEPFFIRRGAAGPELRLLGEGDLERFDLHLPQVFFGETNLICYLNGGFRAVISPTRQKVFMPREYVVRDFQFPFRGMWSSEEEHRRWLEGRGLGDRKQIIGKMARARKRVAESLYQYAVHGPGRESVESALRANGWTNVLMEVEGVSGLEWTEKIKEMKALIGGGEGDRFLRTIRFGMEGDEGRACFFRFDPEGHLRWCFQMRRMEGDSDVKWRLDNQCAFEFSEDGLLHRAFVSGTNPLLVSDGRRQSLVGGPDQIRQFFSDLVSAMKGCVLD